MKKKLNKKNFKRSKILNNLCFRRDVPTDLTTWTPITWQQNKEKPFIANRSIGISEIRLKGYFSFYSYIKFLSIDIYKESKKIVKFWQHPM